MTQTREGISPIQKDFLLPPTEATHFVAQGAIVYFRNSTTGKYDVTVRAPTILYVKGVSQRGKIRIAKYAGDTPQTLKSEDGKDFFSLLLDMNFMYPQVCL
ncbi:MAG: hypothetical protein H6774_00170 [Pseudomonadales bacterium]|nr:hypothetical protein [Candidatus Woesebacteria bacterium]MCB9801490.1 hypothetical protein [Pseudomonadales bacterium]